MSKAKSLKALVRQASSRPEQMAAAGAIGIPPRRRIAKIIIISE
jgi:hypothetical protein